MFSKTIGAKDNSLSISVQQLQQGKVLKVQLWNIHEMETRNISNGFWINEVQHDLAFIFFLLFKSAYNSFSVFKQLNSFLSLFKVLHYKRFSQKQGLKNIFSAYFSPSGLFLFHLLCSVWQNHQKLKGSGGYSLCYILPWHNSKNSQKEPDNMKEQIPSFKWTFKYSFHIVFVCLLKLLFICD